VGVAVGGDQPGHAGVVVEFEVDDSEGLLDDRLEEGGVDSGTAGAAE